MEKVIRGIDPSLVPIERYMHASLPVYKVSRNGDYFIFKVTNGLDRWDIRHINIEKEILKITKDLLGVTHLVKSYPDFNDYRMPILKEFFSGQTLLRLEKRVGNPKLQKKLKDIVDNLHYLGISNLDLDKSSNIVISPDEKDVCLIDLGSGKLLRNIGKRRFLEFKSKDLSDLEEFIFE